MALLGPMLLIGCGKMGGALLAGWLERGLAASDVVLVEPNAAPVAPFVARGCRHYASLSEVPANFQPRVVLLAVKPQMMEGVLAPAGRFAGPQALVLSIAAGKTLVFFEKAFPNAGAIVRAMPNTPAAVGRGMSVLVANRKCGAGDKTLAAELMAAVGETAWVEDEDLINAVTAMSGGGPAYVFLLAEALAEAGVAAGLPRDLAERMARVTVAGSGELLHQAQGETPAQLRQNVTSPAGTTLEALKVLMAADGLQPLVTRAIAAATRRSRELAG